MDGESGKSTVKGKPELYNGEIVKQRKPRMLAYAQRDGRPQNIDGALC